MNCEFCERELNDFSLEASEYKRLICKNETCLEKFYMEGTCDSFVDKMYRQTPTTLIFITWLYLSQSNNKCDYKEIEDIYTMYVSEEGIRDKLGKDKFQMIRYYVLKLQLKLQLYMKHGSTIIYNILNPEYIEQPFRDQLLREKCSHFKFHGSTVINWFSIITNGIKNYSNTKCMLNGNVYGNGIYLSNEVTESDYYTKNDKRSIIGIYEILGETNNYQKTGKIWVVPEESKLLLRYLIINDGYGRDLNGIINQLIRTPKKIETHSRGIKRLYKEFVTAKDNLNTELGIRIECNESNLYTWYVYLSNFPLDSLLNEDMMKYNISEIKLKIEFTTEYPFYPPFIHVLNPIFEGQTAHVTSEGAICMELLTPKGWSQLISMENLLIQIKELFVEGNGRISSSSNSFVFFRNQYSTDKAKESFKNVARSHGWL